MPSLPSTGNSGTAMCFARCNRRRFSGHGPTGEPSGRCLCLSPKNPLYLIPQVIRREVGIAHRSLDRRVPHKLLHPVEIDATHDEPGRVGVPQAVEADLLRGVVSEDHARFRSLIGPGCRPTPHEKPRGALDASTLVLLWGRVVAAFERTLAPPVSALLLSGFLQTPPRGDAIASG